SIPKLPCSCVTLTSLSRVPLPGYPQHLLAVSITRIGEWERLCRKGAGCFTVNHELGDDLMSRHLRQVFRHVKLAEFAREQSGILGSHCEAQQVARVAKDGGADLFR